MKLPKGDRFYIATLLALALSVFVFYRSGENWEVGALVFTASFIAWYSLETYRLTEATIKTKEEMKMANKLSILPRLVLGYHGTQQIMIRNVGKGAAVDILIDIKNEKYFFEFDETILGPDQSDDLKLRVRKGGHIDWDSLNEDPIVVEVEYDRIKPLKKRLCSRAVVCKYPVVKNTLDCGK